MFSRRLLFILCITLTLVLALTPPLRACSDQRNTTYRIKSNVSEIARFISEKKSQPFDWEAAVIENMTDWPLHVVDVFWKLHRSSDESGKVFLRMFVGILNPQHIFENLDTEFRTPLLRGFYGSFRSFLKIVLDGISTRPEHLQRSIFFILINALEADGLDEGEDFINLIRDFNFTSYKGVSLGNFVGGGTHAVIYRDPRDSQRVIKIFYFHEREFDISPDTLAKREYMLGSIIDQIMPIKGIRKLEWPWLEVMSRNRMPDEFILLEYLNDPGLYQRTAYNRWLMIRTTLMGELITIAQSQITGHVFFAKSRSKTQIERMGLYNQFDLADDNIAINPYTGEFYLFDF